MSYETCSHCGEFSPDSEFCPKCGKARKKWCPHCGAWKAAQYSSVEVDDSPGGPPIILAEYAQPAKFCPACGTELQSKGAPHE